MIRACARSVCRGCISRYSHFLLVLWWHAGFGTPLRTLEVRGGVLIATMDVSISRWVKTALQQQGLTVPAAVWIEGWKHGIRFHRHSRCPAAQSAERRCDDSPRQACRDHRPLGIRQVVSCLRHDLCRRPEALRREPLELCPAVPGPDGQARCGLDRRPLAGCLHRPEDDVEESALDRRHRHGDL